jgi:hypothetical protein
MNIWKTHRSRSAFSAALLISRPSLTPRHLTPPSPIPAHSRRRIDLQRRQGLAGRLRSELGKDAPQRADARGERVAVVLDDIVKLLC